MLDGVYASGDCAANAGGANRVCRDRHACAAGLINRRPDFLHAELRHTNIRAWRHTSAGGHDFQTIRAGFQLPPGSYAHSGLTIRLESKEIAVTASDRDWRSGGKDAWTGDEPCIDRIAHAKGHSTSTTQVAQRCNPAAERPSSVGHRAQQYLMVVLHQDIASWVVGVAEDQVHVAIDESWQNCGAGEIEYFRIGGRFPSRADTRDLAIFDVECPITLNGRAGPVNQSSGQYYLHQRNYTILGGSRSRSSRASALQPGNVEGQWNVDEHRPRLG